jgi:Putative transposase DNA-binding domain
MRSWWEGSTSASSVRTPLLPATPGCWSRDGRSDLRTIFTCGTGRPAATRPPADRPRPGNGDHAAGADFDTGCGKPRPGIAAASIRPIIERPSRWSPSPFNLGSVPSWWAIPGASPLGMWAGRRISGCGNGGVPTSSEHCATRRSAPGIQVRLVDERGTSSTCPACRRRVAKPSGRRFCCPHCGFQGHRDLVGAHNIAAKVGGGATSAVLPAFVEHRRAGIVPARRDRRRHLYDRRRFCLASGHPPPIHGARGCRSSDAITDPASGEDHAT